MNFDYIKIDKSFIAQMVDINEENAICRAIVNICHTIGARTVASGVSDARQARKLESIGCQLMYGDWIAPAMTPSSLACWVPRLDGQEF